MRGWAIYARPLSGRGSTLYCYSVFGVETKWEALAALQPLHIAALSSPLFEPVCLPVLRSD